MQSSKNRRILQQAFFPLSSPPPSSPPLPKTQSPFFPIFPSPPPPSLPTLPANVPSLVYPTPSHSSSPLLPALLISLLAISLLSLSAAFLFHRRRRRPSCPPPPISPKPPASSSSVATSAPPPPTSSSEFLYLGTIVNSRNTRVHGQPVNPDDTDTCGAVPVTVSPYRKPGSPELRPLQPLSRNARNNYWNGTDSDDEFYSPKGSENAIASRTSSMRNFEALAEKCGSRSSGLTTPSYPDSNSACSVSGSGSSSPIAAGPVKSDMQLKDPSSDGSPPSPPPPPPPPPRSLRPLTPSPPKRKPPSQSPPTSPLENPRSYARFDETERDLRNPAFLGQTSINQLAPPPPPPPPPVGYWENQIRKRPVHASPVGLKSPAVVQGPAELAENSDSGEKAEETPMPKLKPLHWDKVRASSDREMVWDQLKSSSFKVNEEMIETLFGCNTASAAPKETNMRHPAALHLPRTENMVLDPKKAQNIAILLRALNVTKDEVCEALSEGNTESLGTELLETLLKMAPNKEEELKLKEHKDDSQFKLGPAEKFLKAVLDIPFAFKRVDAMLYIANFESEISYLKNSFETLEAACEELRNSRLFFKLLEAVLKTGNRMNVGTNRGDAHAFKLDTLLKLVDVKGTDGKTTLLHFVVQEIIRTEGSRLSAAKTQANTLRSDLVCKKLGLQVVGGLGGELANVKKAAAMDSEVLSSYVSKLAGGIGRITDVVRWNEGSNSTSSSQQFRETMSRFLKKAEDEIIKVQAQESVALSLVKEITEYFHGNSAREEAHPFRIFMVVRDFLSSLDQVCKEVGKINERSIASSARQFPVPVNPTLPPLFPKIRAMRPESSDDESSSSSSS